MVEKKFKKEQSKNEMSVWVVIMNDQMRGESYAKIKICQFGKD